MRTASVICRFRWTRSVAAPELPDRPQIGVSHDRESRAPEEGRPRQLATFGASAEHLVQLGLLLLLAVGCWRVLAPFFPAILFALVIVSSTWPLYVGLRARLRGRDVVASVVASALVLLVALGPALLLMLGLADAARWALGLLENRETLLVATLPHWIESLPGVGPVMADTWNALRTDPDRLQRLLALGAAPAREVALVSGRALGNAAMQVALATLVLFFLLRNGERLVTQLNRGAERMGGALARELIDTARAAVTGVLFGEIGAGLAQAMLATIGFLIAGLPNPFLLGALTFVLSIVPIGPPLIWGGAAIWLMQHGEAGWALFMVLYGLLGISTIDNVLKPMLISRASHLPFVLALIGVIGGVISFGVVGVFLGPMLLALLIELAGHWLRHDSTKEGEGR